MLLDPNRSKCEKYQKRIVSKDHGSRVQYIAINPEERFEVRHYQLDGDLVKNRQCNDFLVLNDTTKKAYYIELKGRDIKKAVEQLQAGEKICKAELPRYVSFFRVVASKSKTHQMWPKNYRDLLAQVGPDRFQCKTMKMEEALR